MFQRASFPTKLTVRVFCKAPLVEDLSPILALLLSILSMCIGFPFLLLLSSFKLLFHMAYLYLDHPTFFSFVTLYPTFSAAAP